MASIDLSCVVAVGLQCQESNNPSHREDPFSPQIEEFSLATRNEYAALQLPYLNWKEVALFVVLFTNTTV